MKEEAIDTFADGVRTIARSLPYPPTPRIRPGQPPYTFPSTTHSRLFRRRLGWVVVVLLVALASLLTVPGARAAVVHVIRVGVVRIFFEGAPSSTPPPRVTASPDAGHPAQSKAVSPAPTEAPAAGLDQIAGETTLDDAQERADFPIRLPSYPPDLGPPDRVFAQDQGGSAIVLAWLSPEDPSKVRLVLHELSSESWGVKKVRIEALTTTTVDGVPAVWTVGPYLLIYRNGDVVETRIVVGHVLIWERFGVTYRLESGLSLEEAVRVAESLE